MRVVAGEWRGRRLLSPSGRETRPTSDRVREAWMSVVAPQLGDASVLDLFAGSGALGIEALSRGARHATFVENAPAAIRTLTENLTALGVPPERTTILRTDAIRYVERLVDPDFDVVFADPPYEGGFATRLAEIFRLKPFAHILGIEHSRNETIPAGTDLHERRYGDTLLSFLQADDE